MELRKASRQKAKIRVGLAGPSGSGKTYSALLLASGMTDWSKIALIDTENGSGELYANSKEIGEYNYMRMQAPFTPEKYDQAIKACEAAGMEVIIVDSISHEWDGEGGLLEAHDKMPGNSFTNWAKITPRHNAFIQAILRSKCHVLTTVRKKQDYDMTNNGGKVTVQKVGLKEVTREGFEYELTVNLELDIKHNATAGKDRTQLFMDKPEFIITPETGKILKDWCESGADVVVEQTVPEKSHEERLDEEGFGPKEPAPEKPLPSREQMEIQFAAAYSKFAKEKKWKVKEKKENLATLTGEGGVAALKDEVLMARIKQLTGQIV